MKLQYCEEIGKRVNHTFMGYTTYEPGWLYNHDLNRWEHAPFFSDYNYGSHAPCRSAKAFRRKLKNAPKGVKFILDSRWVGCDIIGYGNKQIKKDNL